jgi:hypothetical protein
MKPRTSQPTLAGHLTDRDVRILEDLERFRLLTTRQLQRLHFRARPFGPHATVSGATRGTTRVLKRLESHGAISRLDRRIGGIKHGSAVTLWQLGAAGERVLRHRDGRTQRRRYDEPGGAFTAHAVAVADVVVAMRERAAVGDFELLALQAEPMCWRTFNGPGTVVTTLKPDLFAVTADATTETYSFVEVDLGTEHLPAVLRKCHTYQRYHAAGAEQRSNGVFPAVVWIVKTERRADSIRSAINGEPDLDAALFWIITSDSARHQLAPYARPDHH